MSLRDPLLVALALLAMLVIAPQPAFAGPVKCDADDVTPDDRVFPEPTQSQTFLRFAEFECGVTFLEATYPDLVQITVLGESAGGHPIYDVLLTDETVPPPVQDGREEKEKLLVVSSIHGNEVGGREGAVRVIEDLLDPLLAGEDWVGQVLDQYVIHFLFPNPDGWALADDVGPTAMATRGNANGTDLNRQFPVEGYIYTPNRTLAEPESQAILASRLTEPGWFLGTDNHGQGPDTYAAAGLQIVGQFDFGKSETLARFADGITEAMAEYDVLSSLAALNTASGQDIGPYHWGTLYDMLGYSASGSLIDYYNTADQLSGTGFATELTVGSEVNYALHFPLLNQVYVDSIRAINFTMFRQAVDRQEYVYPVGGRVGYLFDPEVVRHDDANGAGYAPDTEAGETTDVRPYAVTRMRFFEDLNRFADNPLTAVAMGDVLDGSLDLRTFDSLVIADDWLPGEADAAAWLAALQAFVEAGGNLVVTDAAAPLLAELGLVAEGDITMDPHYVGSVEEFTDLEHPLNADLRGVASQTFDTVPIGIAFPPAGEHAPNWTVAQPAWEAGGGFTAGTNGATRAVYGEKPLGEGVVRFLGALLPQPTEDFYHPYGLQNYAVTYTGYTLLANMLQWTNPSRVDPTVDVRRVFGDGRITTAIALSQEAFESAEVALLARADRFPDALAAATLAGVAGAPVLLTGPDGLDPAVSAELERLGVTKVYVLGGEQALSAQVESDLEGFEVERVGGDDRYGTAALVAAEVAELGGAVEGAIVAVGDRGPGADAGPDAIASGVLGAAAGSPVLLARADEVPEATLDALEERLEPGATVTLVGGTAVLSEGVERQLTDAGWQVERIAGDTRFATAAAVADRAVAAGLDTRVVGLATGAASADALAAGPALHHLGGAMLLVDPADLANSEATATWLTANTPATVLVAGGPAAIAESVLDQVRTLLS